MLTSTCLDVHLHAYMHISMLIHVDWCVYMLRSMFSTRFIPSSMCLCAPCHVCVPRSKLCLSCHVLLQPFCRFIFLSCVLAYWFKPDLDPMVFVIIHIPWPISKGLDHPFCMSMFACFYALCLCQPLQFQALPHLTPLAGHHCVVTSDAHGALFGCSHLGCIVVMLVASCTPSPFSPHEMICLPCLFVPPVGLLCIFTRLFTCPYMSLACQL